MDDGVKLGADGGAEQGEAEAELAADCAAEATACSATEGRSNALAEQQWERATNQGVRSDVLTATLCRLDATGEESARQRRNRKRLAKESLYAALYKPASLCGGTHCQ